MKTNLLVFLVTVLVLVSPAVLATDVIDESTILVEVNDINADSNVLAVESGEVVPIDVFFTALEDASDVEVSAWIQGERSDGVEKDFRDLLSGKEYHARLSLRVTDDLDEIDEDITLYVRIETDNGNWEEAFTLSAQREPDKADILFVEVDKTVDVGVNIPVDIVVKNLGRDELDDLIVEVSIPELGIGKRAYFGDLQPTDECPSGASESCDDDEFEDAVERRVYLKIPSNTQAGAYELVVEAYNDDTISGVKKTITIVGSEEASQVIVPVSSKELGAGQEKTYTLILINSGSNIGIYELIPETAEGVIVSVNEPIVTVPAGSSRIVEVNVQAGSREGTYSFAVDVTSEGELVDRAVMSANVVKGSGVSGVATSNLTILTVILAIIFAVLLIVLIVLLTRKSEKPEEFEESYY